MDDGAGAASAVRESELSAAEAGVVLARLGLVVVGASGSDAATFLHGQVANDVTGIGAQGANRTLLLNHRGHALAEGSALKRSREEVLLALEDGGAEWALNSLNDHIIFDDVRLERLGMVGFTLQGAEAARLLPAAPEAGKFVETELAGAPLIAYRVRRSSAGGFDLLVGEENAEAVRAALLEAGAVEVGGAVLDALRVRAGVPLASREGGEGVLPQEAGLEFALSYRKGCYLGQEIMARIEARGNMRRSLARLELSGPLPLPDSAGEPVEVRQITSGGRRVGLLGTVAALAPEGATGEARFEALAVLRNDLPAGAELEVGGVSAKLL